MGPPLLVRAALILLIAGAAIVTPTDADLWGHLTFGRDILTTGKPVQIDRYSFTADRAWVNHEWLAEVVLFAVYRAGGSFGLIVFKLLIIAALLLFAWKHVRRFAGQDLSWMLIVVVFVGTFWRTHNARPQLFSVLLMVLLLLCVTAADAGRRRWLLLIPPIIALWANLHGGWIIGLAVYGIWAAARLIDRRVSTWERVFPILIALLAAAATLLNPWGAQLWQFLAETVRPARADIEDWGSITQYPLVLGTPWLLTVLLAGLAIWRAGLPRRLDYLAVIGGLSIFAFLVSRVDAFFVLSVVILLTPQISTLWTDRAARPSPRQPTGVVAITVAGILAVILSIARFAAPYATCLPISGDWAPDARAARFIAEHRLSGRMITWFDWGEYVIWHFGPALKVSMDGRRETVYSDATIQAQRAFYGGDGMAMPYLRELSADFVWLPAHLPVARQLAGEGWLPVFTSPASIVWARSILPAADATVAPLSERRCFPGP